MSKLFSELNQEAKRQQALLNQQSIKLLQTDIAQSVRDVPTSESEKVNKGSSAEIQPQKLQTIITELSQIPVAPPTTVRLSEIEKRDLEDFILDTLRKKGLQGQAVSGAKLMRYALRYMMKVHTKEFVEALQVALKQEEKLSI